MLVVMGQDAPRGIYPGNGDDGSGINSTTVILTLMVCEFPSPSDLLPGVQSKVMSILGIELWIWIVTGVGCVVLIILVITAVIVYQKKKGTKVRDSVQ